jgi:hypothetical protein
MSDHDVLADFNSKQAIPSSFVVDELARQSVLGNQNIRKVLRQIVKGDRGGEQGIEPIVTQ